MEKRISIKTIYLLLVISIGLIGLGLGSTYAIFTARAEIDSPIVISSNLTHESEVLETIEIEVPAKEVITTTLNISNTSENPLNYSIWFIDEGEVVFLDSVSSTGSLLNGSSTSVNLNILNKEDKDVIVNLGISSSPDSIVLGSDMKKIDEDKAYAVYTEDDNSLSFYRTSDIISVGNTYNNKSVTNVYTGFENSNYETVEDVPWFDVREKIATVNIYDTVYPKSTKNWFNELKNCSSIDLTKLNTSNIVDMKLMFYNAGSNVSDFEIIGLNTWDTSNVGSMEGMFENTGRNSAKWSIGDLSNWDTSSVMDMSSMFLHAGEYATTWNIGHLNNWNTSRVTSMNDMFSFAGHKAKSWDIGDLCNWDTSLVTRFNSMFDRAGYYATIWNIGNLSNWDTSSATDMKYMFARAGANATTLNIGNLSNWDTSNVTDMRYMFGQYGNGSATPIELDLSGWDTSKVKNMNYMFTLSPKIKTIYVSELWNTSEVTSSIDMFKYCSSLVGGSGTTYSDNNPNDKTYAHIDGGTSNPGYFTLKTTQ